MYYIVVKLGITKIKKKPQQKLPFDPHNAIIIYLFFRLVRSNVKFSEGMLHGKVFCIAVLLPSERGEINSYAVHTTRLRHAR